MKNETEFRDKHVIPLAKVLGWRHYFTYRSTYSPAGFPDLVLVRRDRLVFAELKMQKGRLSPLQTDWLHDIRTVARAIQTGNVEVHVWRPADWHSGDIEEVLR